MLSSSKSVDWCTESELCTVVGRRLTLGSERSGCRVYVRLETDVSEHDTIGEQIGFERKQGSSSNLRL